MASEITIHEVDHSKEWGDQPTIPFSQHFLSEITAMLLLMSLLTVLCIFLPSHLDIKADPVATPEGSKPEWYFMFLFAYLHFVPPLVGTFTPAILVGLLMFLPWLDRNPSREPSKRVIAIVVSIIILVVIVGLTIVGYTE